MQARALLAIGLVLIPSLAAGQLRPRGRPGSQPPRATPSGPQPRVISEALRYRRLNISVEGYTFVSRMDVPTVGGVPGQAFTSAGSGTRFEYRFHRLAASTLDVTSSFIGGPILNQTAELGLRLGPSRASADVVPFVDLRGGYFYSLPRQQLGNFVGNPAINFASVMDYSHGPAAVAGAGVEFALTRAFSLTTSGHIASARMTSRPNFRASTLPNRYTMNSARFSVSLRYNGVRTIR